jgi:hypothetical protein
MRKPIIRSNVNPLALPTLFFAGRATLTFRNTEKETHMTVKVKQATDKNDRKKKLPIFFVSVSLIGDRETGYVHAATIFQDVMNIKLSNKVEEGSQLHKVIQFVWNAVRNPQILRDKKVALLHEGKCCRCSMPLTHPESINTGFGPDCLSYILAGKGIQVDDLFFKVEA